MLLKLTAPTSAGARAKRWLTFFNPFKAVRSPKLKTGFVKSSGRNNSGKKTILSKGHKYGSLLYRSSTTSLSKARILGCVIKLEHGVDFTSGSALIKTAIGCWYYIRPSHKLKTLSYLGVFDKDIPYSLSSLNDKNWFNWLKYMAPHTKICHLTSSSKPLKPTYSLSAGCHSLLVTPVIWEGWSFVILPSGQLKLLPELLTALPGISAPAFKGLTNCAKAIKFKLKGKKSTSRGVAKNPNDHPHGGRAKTVKNPRTPWGLTAKKSRAPQFKHKLRPLSKRKITKTVLTENRLSLYVV